MSLFRTPGKVYFKSGCLDIALDELKTVYGVTKAFIVADKELYLGGVTSAAQKKLDEMQIQHSCFFALGSSPTLEEIGRGAAAMKLFGADTIIAVGSTGAIEAAKVMRVMYECPGADIPALCAKTETFPSLGTMFVAVPAMLDGIGCISPSANFSSGDEDLFLTDYELLPEMTIVDPAVMCSQSVRDLEKFRDLLVVLAYTLYVGSGDNNYVSSFAFKGIDILINKLPEEFEDVDIKVLETFCEAVVSIGIAWSNNSDAPEDDSAFDEKTAELANALGIQGESDAEKSGILIKKLKLF